MNPFLGEIRLFAGNFAPQGWAYCDGTLLSIADNEALYTLVGTTYGGDGVNNFALPDMRGRVPVHQGSTSNGSYVIGQTGGVESVTLTNNEMPSHNHTLIATTKPGDKIGPNKPIDPTGKVFAQTADDCKPYIALNGTFALNAAHIAPAGGSALPHDNMQPYVAINYIIATSGLFPSQN